MTVTLEVDFDFRALVNRIVLYLSIYSLVVVNESGDEYSMAQNLTHHNLSFIAQMGKQPGLETCGTMHYNFLICLN